MKTKCLIKLVILGTIIDSFSLGTEKNFLKIDKTPIIQKMAPDLEKIIFQRQPKIETKENINSYINETYKNLQIPDHITKRFIKKVINAESDNYTHAISPVGARGLMQLTQVAWKQVEKEDYYNHSFDPKLNIEVGIKYLLHLDKYLENNYPGWNSLPANEKRRLMSAAYNGGIGRLEKRKWEIENMPKETQRYVKDVYTN